jgi:poly(3-hydroxyoctanoate) depolymerase
MPEQVIKYWTESPFSPVSVGQRLASLLSNAKLHVFPGGNHDLASVFAHKVAPLINEHLSKRNEKFLLGW